MEEKKKRQKRTNSRAGKFVAGAYKNLGPSFSLSLIALRVVCNHGTAAAPWPQVLCRVAM